jgi:competence protein ComEC
MNDTQRKLALIDKQLAGQDLHRKIIDTCPLLFIAVGLMAGIIIQSRFDLSIAIWLAILFILSGAAIVTFCFKQINLKIPYIAAYIALMAFICFGAIRLINFQRLDGGNISSLVGENTTLAAVRGTIVTEPFINRNQQWKFAEFQFTDPASSFYLEVQEVETVNGWSKSTGTIWMRINEPVFDLKIGYYIQAYCLLDRFTPPTNPGEFNIAEYMANRKIFIRASIESIQSIETIRTKPPSSFFRIRNYISQSTREALLDGFIPNENNSGLLQALLIGYRKNIDSDTYEAFRKTGLLHIISLSGMHFAILIGIIWWLCKTAGLLKPARAVICIAATVVFTLVVPPNAPTLRAAIISFIFCISIIFGKHPHPVNTLSLAAMVLLLARPTQLFEADWQLSFAAVLGILTLTDRFAGFFKERIGEQFILMQNPGFGKRLIKKIVNDIIMLFCVGFAAWLGGTGILLYHFYTINPLSVLYTALVSPLVSAIMLIGFLKIILFFIFPTISSFLGSMVISLSAFFIWIVKIMAEIDISQILIGHISQGLEIFYYGTILFIVFAKLKRPLIKKTASTAALTVLVILLGIINWQRTHHKELIMTALDVGHGQAIVAQFPGGANIIFDTGSIYRSDTGRRIVTPFLNYTGINNIKAIIISHGDIDHINGIPEIAAYHKVSGVYADEAPFTQPALDSNSPEGFLNQSLNEIGLTIENLSETSNPVNITGIEILWPVEGDNYSEISSDNDKSLVLLMEFAGKKILLCSDIEQAAQKEILRLYPDLKAEVVVVPHHGSTATLEPGFLERLEPNILICSCGRDQYQSFSNSTALQNISSDANKAFFTCTNGATTIRIDKKGNIKSSVTVHTIK